MDAAIKLGIISGTLIAFWSDNKSLIVRKFAEYTIPLKDWDTLIEQLEITFTVALLL